MEYQKIINLLRNISNNQLSKFITRKYIEVFDQSDGTYNVSKDIRFKAPQLRSDLCDWEDAYNVVTGKITVTNPSNDAYDKKLALKNNAPFFSCVLRINEELIDDCQGLDIVMPLYNLLYYSKNIIKQRDLCGIITEMNQILLHKEILTIQLEIQSLLTIKQV